MLPSSAPAKEIDYPDSDGMPMADNSKQFRWIVTIEGNLENLYRDDPNVFVAGDMLWYPVEGNNKIRIAPDAMVAFGRPKGDRGSYRQWVEGGVAPHVAFEVLSPGNTHGEMIRKYQFYDKYGVEEYYQYDPDRNLIDGWIRKDERLLPIENMDGWVSPRLGIRFELSPDTLVIYRPDGERFFSFEEIFRERDEARQRSREDQLARQQAQQRADAAQQRAEALAEKLRTLGFDPDSV